MDLYRYLATPKWPLITGLVMSLPNLIPAISKNATQKALLCRSRTANFWFSRMFSDEFWFNYLEQQRWFQRTDTWYLLHVMPLKLQSRFCPLNIKTNCAARLGWFSWTAFHQWHFCPFLSGILLGRINSLLFMFAEVQHLYSLCLILMLPDQLKRSLGFIFTVKWLYTARSCGLREISFIVKLGWEKLMF